MTDENVVEKTYKCPKDGTVWSGIEGKVPTVCPDCGTEAEDITEKPEETPAGETPVEKPEETNAGKPDETPVEKPEVETATYAITGLVDIFDEQGVIRGQYPVGSEQVLPVDRGDAAVESGNATRVE